MHSARIATVVVAVALLTLSQRTVRTQEAPLPATTYRSGVDLVTVTATVENRDGSFTDGLTANDFSIYENGAPQTIALFGVNDVPLDLILLVDGSASMSVRLAAVRHAAGLLIDALQPHDRATLVTFGGLTRRMMPLTEDRDALHAALDAVRAGGNTPLYDGIYMALRTFGGRDPSIRRRAIVVLSDGEDTASLLSFDTVLQTAQQTGMTIYTVMLADTVAPGTSARARAMYEMRTLATDTGGRCLLAADDRALDPLYHSIARELTHQYVLGYVSAHPPARHQFAKILLKVARENVSVRTRRGYFTGP